MMENLFDKEWIITNGLGGYASSTVEWANTRRYHGLLVASLNPPTDRKVLVAKVEERVFVNNEVIDLSTNKYRDVIYPKGYNYLKEFSAAPLPNWKFQAENFSLTKELLMVKNENATLVKYVNTGDSPLVFEIHPLYSFTGYHTLFHENRFTDFYSELNKNQLKTYPHYQSIPVFTKWSAGNFIEKRDWYKNIYLPKEKDRGLDYICDYYRIGYIRYELQPKEEITVLFTLNEDLVKDNLNELFEFEKQKLLENIISYKSKFYGDLIRSGNQFLVNRKSTNSHSIIAGYHWFSDWGRDTMIAMRGLSIATGNKEVSKSILSTFLKSIDRGMLPNRFPDNSADTIEYNTIDATLWLFVALYDYHKKFNDLPFIKDQITVLQEILDWHIKGTRYNIHVTPKGFLFGGTEGVQLTWMDAKVNGKVVTPRMGCPVEINALWYNALKIYGFLCEEIGVRGQEAYEGVLSKIKIYFVKDFMNEEGTLYDVVVPNVFKDNSFRSNQIYSISLPFSILNNAQQKHIFEAVRNKLFTPYGLRTLEVSDPEFISVYKGSQWERDHAYHQGTVWPYILGAYYEAFFKIYGDSLENKQLVVNELKTLKAHFYNNQGLHCISEIFDGKDPEHGKGTIQQAWSVSALIKLYADYKLYDLED